LSAVFALLALVLSAGGLYGVIANAADKELGIRLALGAEPRRVVRMITQEAAVLIRLGISVGVPAACVLVRALESLLFGVQPWRRSLLRSPLERSRLSPLPPRGFRRVAPRESIR